MGFNSLFDLDEAQRVADYIGFDLDDNDPNERDLEDYIGRGDVADLVRHLKLACAAVDEMRRGLAQLADRDSYEIVDDEINFYAIEGDAFIRTSPWKYAARIIGEGRA